MFEAISFAYALADQTRWRIAMLVADQTLCVCELEDGLRLPQSTLSSHLATMRTSGLLEVHRRDKWAFYSMVPSVRPLFEAMRHHFEASLAADPQFAVDRKRTAERVALRGQTDCKSPRRRAIPPALTETGASRCC